MFARFAASSRISTVRRARNMAAPTRPPPPTGNQLKKNWLSDPGTYPVRKIKDTKILRDKDLTPKILLYMFRLFSLCFVHHLFFFFNMRASNSFLFWKVLFCIGFALFVSAYKIKHDIFSPEAHFNRSERLTQDYIENDRTEDEARRWTSHRTLHQQAK